MRFLSLLLLLAFFGNSGAQTVLDNTRFNEKWMRIKTDRFNVVFPESFRGTASEVASLLDTLYYSGRETVSDRPSRKITYIIRNQQAVSNGFVGLGPWRSELFTTPPQDYRFLGTNDWLRKLIVHEYRHVAQYTQANRGLTRVASVLTGQNSLAAISYAVMPLWFWEGDAVLTETAFTRSGRGRLPAFSRIYRTNLLEGNRFSYEKQYLGSYKDNVPNHYVLGNYMVPYVRSRSGDPMIWEKVSERAMKTPLLPLMFSWSMKKETGKGIRGTYNDMMDELGQTWEERFKEIDPMEFVSVPIDGSSSGFLSPEFYTDHAYPVPVGEDSFLFVRSGLENIPAIEIRRGNKTEKLHTLGVWNNTGMWFADSDYVVWNEFTFHERWRSENYSDIKILNLHTGRVKRLTRRQRYLGAALSPDHSQLATTTTDDNYRHYILLLNSGNGEEVGRYHDEGNAHFTHVRFMDDQSLIAVKTDASGKSLVRFELPAWREEVLISPGVENFGFPVYHELPGGKQVVFYNSDYSGVDDIYALDLADGERYRVTRTRYGAYNPAPRGAELMFNIQTVDGLRVVQSALDPSSWEPVNEVRVFPQPFYQEVFEQEQENVNEWELDTAGYEVKRYNRLLNIINPHSWGPFVNTDLSEVQLGIFSRDIMNTTDLYGGVSFNRINRSFRYELEASVQAFYPILDFEYAKFSREESFEYIDEQQLEINWDEDNISAGIRLPFQFTASKWNTELDLEYFWRYSRVTNFENNLFSGRFDEENGRVLFGLQNSGDFVYEDWSLTFYNTMRRAHRHVQPRWGQILRLQGIRTLSDQWENRLFTDLFGSQFSARLLLFFPGLLRSHSLNGYASFQKNQIAPDKDNYWFSRKITGPRGVNISTWDKLYTAGVNYEFPLWSPDLRLGPVFNLKRIRLTGFFDAGYGSFFVEGFNQSDRFYRSTGGEIRFDFNLMRFRPEIRAGFRYSYSFGDGTSYEFIFPVVQF